MACFGHMNFRAIMSLLIIVLMATLVVARVPQAMVGNDISVTKELLHHPMAHNKGGVQSVDDRSSWTSSWP